jgi:hypothetical protein
MGSKGAPILLVDGTTGAGFDYAKSVLANKMSTIAFLGGTGAVPANTSKAVTSLWSGTATEEANYMQVEYALPTSVSITGMSGNTAKDNDTPAKGDVLKAVFPDKTADSKATYQWYRGTTALTGETTATHTVTANDAGAKLKVVVTLSNGKTLEATTANAASAAQTISAYKVMLVKDTDKSSATGKKYADLAVTAPKTTDTLATLVYKDTNADGIVDASEVLTQGTDYSVAWYNNASDTTPIAGDATQALSAQIGKTVYAIVTGTESYTGKLTTDKTATITTGLHQLNKFSSDTGEVTGDNGTGSDSTTNVYADGTTLKANLETSDAAAKATVTYQWSKIKNSVATTITGATNATYQPTAADAADGVTGYRVAVTGTGNWSGTVKRDITITWSETDVQVISEVFIQKNAENVSVVNAGDTLTAATTPAKAASSDKLTFTWSFDANGDTPDVDASKNETKTGTTYTVPTTAAAGATVKLTVTSTDASVYTVATAPSTTGSTATVKSTITKAELTLDDTNKNGVAEVGEKLKVTVTPAEAMTGAAVSEYKWYYADNTDKTEIAGAAAATAEYTLAATDIGHKIVCEVTGKAEAYAGATATSNESTMVVGSASLTVSKNGTDISSSNLATQGDVLVATVKVGANSITDEKNTVYSWKLNGTEVNTTKTYTIPGDATGVLTLTVSGKATGSLVEASTGSLTWNNTGVAIQKATVTVLEKIVAAADKDNSYTNSTLIPTANVGDVVYAKADGGKSPYTYKWVDLQTGDTVSTASSAVMYGKYTQGLQLTVTDSNGVSATPATVTIAP